MEDRLAAIHDMARKHRVRPEALPALLAETEARLASLADSADAAALAKRAAEAEAQYRDAAEQLSKKRRFHANELAHRVTEIMQTLAMAGGRFEVALEPRPRPRATASTAWSCASRAIPNRRPAPLARVASGGELSRIALAMSVVASEGGHGAHARVRRGRRGIGGAVAATVGGLMQALGAEPPGPVRDPSPAGGRVRGHALARDQGEPRRGRRASELALLDAKERVEELARMLGGAEITAKTRAHAKEMYEQPARQEALAARPQIERDLGLERTFRRRLGPVPSARCLRRGCFVPASASDSPVSSQCLTRCASPTRVNLPIESSSTITIGLARDVGEHHDATAGFADVAGLLQLDVPRAALHQRVGVVEAERLAARLHLDEMGGRRRVVADQRVIGRGAHEPRQVVGRRHVAAATGRSSRRNACASCRAPWPCRSSRRRRRACRQGNGAPARKRRGSRRT